MYNTTQGRWRQLLPTNEELTGPAQAIELANQNFKVLYLCSTVKRMYRMLAADTRAARVGEEQSDTLIYVGTLTDSARNKDYDHVVLDVGATPNHSRKEFTRFLDEQAPDVEVWIAYSDRNLRGPVVPLRLVRGKSTTTAAEVGGSYTQAFGHDDETTYYARAEKLRSWTLHAFHPDFDTHDISAEVSRLKPDRFRIRRAAKALAVLAFRKSSRCKKLERWAGRTLRDEEAELELGCKALSVLCAIWDPNLAKQDQMGELHKEHGAEHRTSGADRYADHRAAIFSVARVLLRALPPRVRDAVRQMQEVTVTASDSVALQRSAEAVFAKDGWRAVDLADPKGGTLQKLMRKTAKQVKPSVRRILGALRKVGYEVLERTKKSEVDAGIKRRWTSCRVGPRLNPPHSELRSGATPAIPGFSREVPVVLYSSPPLYREPPGPPSETARDTAFNLTAGHPAGSPPPLQVFLKPGWRALSIPAAYSEDKRKRAEKGAAWMMKTAKQDCAAPHQDWESLLLPSEKSFCSSKDSARVLSKGTNIGRYFRGSVCAPQGQRFVNWDIQACHMRIARTLLRLVSQSPYFDAMFADGDVYAAFGLSFGMTREQAKTATLILLNGGGLGAQGLITISGLDPSTLPGIYAAWLNNGNNPWLNARKKLVENYGQHLPADKTLAQKISLLMQECENDILQLTVKRMRATPDVPMFRWALPMYDGSLFLCAEADAPQLTEIAKACAEEACRLRKVNPVVHANHGATWAEAEGK